MKMLTKLREIPDKIDLYFENKTLKEEIIFYLLIVLVIGFVIFYFWLPSVQQQEMAAKKQYNTTQKTYLNLQRDYKIKMAKIMALNKKIIDIKQEINDLSDKVDIYNEMAKSLYYTLFDDYKWGEFMKSLVERSKKYDLNVVNISNKLYDKKDAIITKKLSVNLRVNGDYKDIIKFIYSYENTKDLLRVENLKINKDKTYDIQFVFYGVNP